MAKEVVLTPTVEENYEAILDYVFKNFGGIVTNNFINRFWEACLLISETLEIYPFSSKSKQVRKCVVTKHNTIYFNEYTNFIRITVIFDNRQDPDKLNSIIKRFRDFLITNAKSRFS
jgi:plasmid stabilization system protein ParE